uniref:Arf-GAP domain-containing protein n=1 Tax=Steinernema glaseri TaxID=37863 RepID=A0A1I7Z0M7_9BILA
MDSASICADCGAKDPEWASLNRCVLVCSECCYVHRNLGSHLSRIRSLKHGVWSKEQLELIRFLYASGSNNIWEHSLIDPTSSNKAKIKPIASDAVIPTKENFIKTKYSQLLFTLKPSRDETSLDDLNRQLWSCVRTDRVETTLRLLALGADVHYADPEKQNTPLHVAAKENQPLQVELLSLYGADPARPNAGDLTAVDVARLENHNDLAARLEEIQFEVTDRLSLFLCGRRPDHSRQVHFLVPELVGSFQQRMGPTGEIAKVRREMTTLSGKQLEKLSQDIYDEIDRRDVVRAWNASHNSSQTIDIGSDQFVAVFLPPNPALSATRNQLRQKLAKYDTADFATLIIDVLTESKRRFYDLPVKNEDPVVAPPSKTRDSSKANSTQNSENPSLLFDDGNRDYDEVAESPRSKSRTSNLGKRWSANQSESGEKNQTLHPEVTLDDYLELKEKLNESNAKVRDLTISNSTILRHLSSIQEMMTELKNDNIKMHAELKSQKDHNLALLRRNPSPTTHLHSPANAPVPFAKPREEFYGGDGNGMPGAWDAHAPKTFGGYSTVRNPPPVGYGQPRPVEKYRGATSDIPFFSKYADALIKETEIITDAIRNLLTDAQCNMLADTSIKHAITISRLIQKIAVLIPEPERTRRIEVVMNRMVEASNVLTDCCSTEFINNDKTCSAAYDLAKTVKEYLKLVTTGQD